MAGTRLARPTIRRGVRLAASAGAAALTAAAVFAAVAWISPAEAKSMRPTAGSSDTLTSPAPGFVLDNGRFTTFDAPGATIGTNPTGINDLGDVVGKFNDGTSGSGAGAREHGFVRDRRGRFTRIDVPGATGSATTRINDRRQIVGVYSTTNGRVGDDDRARSFLLERGRYAWIDKPGAMKTQAFGLNNLGTVVGEYSDSAGHFHGFRWDRGRFTTIDVPGSSDASLADINDLGQMVGLCADPDDPTRVVGFLRDSDGRVTTFDVGGAPATLPFGIDNRGRVVGFTIPDPAAGAFRGFLLAGGVKGPVTPVAYPGSPSTTAAGIDERGRIVGQFARPGAAPRGAMSGAAPSMLAA
jgi:uncharacterized membrane protein